MADGMIAGIYHMWLALRDSAGYSSGVTPGGPGNGTLEGAYVVKHPVEVQPLQPTYSQATSRGGQQVRARRDLGVSEYGTIQVTLAHHDEGLNDLIRGTTQYESASGVTVRSSNINKADPPSLIVGLSVGFSDEDGAQQFITYIENNVQMRGGQIGGSQNDGVNPNPLTYTLTPNISQRTGVGIPFGETGTPSGVENNTDVDTILRGDRQFHSVRYTDDGAASSITLPFLPSSDDEDDHFFVRNGVDASGSVGGINTTTGVISITAGTAGDIWQITYQTNYVPSPTP